jgi:hypothetical protein
MEEVKAKIVSVSAADHATQTDSGRPRSSIRLSTSAAIAISLAWAASVWKRRVSPMTCFQRPTWLALDASKSAPLEPTYKVAWAVSDRINPQSIGA